MQSKILNEGTSAISNMTSANKYSFFGSLEFGYFITRSIGITSGVGYNVYKGLLSLSSYQDNHTAIDEDNESYEQRVSASGVQELQSIGYLSVPVCLAFRLPIGEKAGVFVQAGADVTLPMKKNYESSGIFTYKGYYSAYNVLLEDMPQHGFPSNYSSNTEGDLELKSLGFNLLASAGFDFSLSQKLQLAIGGAFDKSLSSISQYTSTDEFQLSSEVDQINSMMGGSSKATTQLISLKIVLRYYFR